ncbi:TolC family protein [Zobellia uliginosa]|uniref:TolC family protein n=1 Tax=Zobellia uliginosa TaxID=143224 RepID=UPI0026E3BCD3|nr:efflux transporter outer membrane subunit [Zobellia uliginosa]MDO6519714.1 efflux transporter outer membrane subunit [Zobellia uliginosa]
MYKRIIYMGLGIACLSLTFSSCKSPAALQKTANTAVPESYNGSQDSTNTATVTWREYFKDPHLRDLIDTALANNQELNIVLREIAIAKSEVREKKGEYLPFVGLRAGAGLEKVGRYTSQGANDANTDIRPGEEFPEPLGDFLIGAEASWEIDVWHKLRNAKKAAVTRYLSSIEGRNFMVTNLIAEIADSYYELLALDNELAIVKQNIDIQGNALEIVKLQKAAAKVNELAVKKFEAEVLHTKSLQFELQQQIVQTENKINFLLGRYPQPIEREHQGFEDLVPETVHLGLPSQLLANRPDIKQAELDLMAAKLDVKVAKARFYPSLGISAGVGFQSFNTKYLLETPESLLYSVVGDLTAPLINRNAIKAAYYGASAKQLQAVYNYEQTILNAYVEVVNQLAKIDNLEKSYDLRSKEVEALTASIDISNRLFKSARADYMEVLLTQRDALEAKVELIETKQKQMSSVVNVYRALGGGWN